MPLRNSCWAKFPRQAGKWDVAVQHFSRSANLDAGFSETYLALGMSLCSAGNFSQAISPLEKYVTWKLRTLQDITNLPLLTHVPETEKSHSARWHDKPNLQKRLEAPPRPAPRRRISRIRTASFNARNGKSRTWRFFECASSRQSLRGRISRRRFLEFVHRRWSGSTGSFAPPAFGLDAPKHSLPAFEKFQPRRSGISWAT